MGIGKAKAMFFIYGSGFFLLLIFLTFVLKLIVNKEKPTGKTFKKSDYFMILFGISVWIASSMCKDKKVAFWGEEGWHTGLIFYLLICFMYLMISEAEINLQKLLGPILLTAFVINVIGILDRFSVYVLPLKQRDPAYLSTMGNINWFCGYLSVLLPLGCGLFVMTKKKTVLLGIYAFVGFLLCLSQGGASVFIILLAMFSGLLLLSFSENQKLMKIEILIYLFCLAAQILRFIRYLFPEAYNYETDNVCDLLTSTGTTVYLAAAVFIIFSLWKRIKLERIKKILIYFAVLSGIIGVAYTFLRGFDDAWGNGRGFIWKFSLKLWLSEPFSNKLWGVGPDGYRSYAYGQSELIPMLRGYFGNDVLSNAHNELLTMLIQFGIFGIAVFCGFFVSYLLELRELDDTDGLKSVILICISSYLMHNMVSFTHVLNLPFLILLMALCRKSTIGKNGSS